MQKQLQLEPNKALLRAVTGPKVPEVAWELHSGKTVLAMEIVVRGILA